MSELSLPLHRRLPYLAPHALDEAVGYRLDTRFYGMHWEPGGDFLYLTDGLRGYTAPGWGFIIFSQHHAVRAFLDGYDFGSEEHMPLHMLVIDRETRQMFALHPVEGRRFLQSQHPRFDPDKLSQSLAELDKASNSVVEEDFLEKYEVLDAFEKGESIYPDLEAELDAGLHPALSLS